MSIIAPSERKNVVCLLRNEMSQLCEVSAINGDGLKTKGKNHTIKYNLEREDHEQNEKMTHDHCYCDIRKSTSAEILFVNQQNSFDLLDMKELEHWSRGRNKQMTM